MTIALLYHAYKKGDVMLNGLPMESEPYACSHITALYMYIHVSEQVSFARNTLEILIITNKVRCP